MSFVRTIISAGSMVTSCISIPSFATASGFCVTVNSSLRPPTSTGTKILSNASRRVAAPSTLTSDGVSRCESTAKSLLGEPTISAVTGTILSFFISINRLTAGGVTCITSPLAKRALTRIVCVPTESLLKFTKAKISLSGIFASAVRVPLTRTLTFSGTLNTIIPSARLREASGIANSFSTIGFCSLIT